MDEDHQELLWLQHQVDQAVAEVRHDEVGSVFSVALFCASLPMLLVLAALLLH
ncbi:hypothetical protein [Pseudonocardia sp.]|jgi:hypothetical protein|uniref:hypothetical protein n=1 Tax=Pseudonocardia sp. TaxID=60912 RepID=UPI0031FDF94A